MKTLFRKARISHIPENLYCFRYKYMFPRVRAWFVGSKERQKSVETREIAETLRFQVCSMWHEWNAQKFLAHNLYIQEYHVDPAKCSLHLCLLARLIQRLQHKRNHSEYLGSSVHFLFVDCSRQSLVCSRKCVSKTHVWTPFLWSQVAGSFCFAPFINEFYPSIRLNRLLGHTAVYIFQRGCHHHAPP